MVWFSTGGNSNFILKAGRYTGANACIEHHYYQTKRLVDAP